MTTEMDVHFLYKNPLHNFFFGLLYGQIFFICKSQFKIEVNHFCNLFSLLTNRKNNAIMGRKDWGCISFSIVVIILFFFSIFAWFMYLVEYVDLKGYTAGICRVIYLFVQSGTGCFQGVAMFHIDINNDLSFDFQRIACCEPTK